MSNQFSQKYRIGIALLVLAMAGATAAYSLTRPAPETEAAELQSVVQMDAKGFRYEFHLPTGTERLFVVRDGAPVLADVSRHHPDVLASCRTALAAKHGVTDIEALRARYDDTVRRLHALGYL